MLNECHFSLIIYLQNGSCTRCIECILNKKCIAVKPTF